MYTCGLELKAGSSAIERSPRSPFERTSLRMSRNGSGSFAPERTIQIMPRFSATRILPSGAKAMLTIPCHDPDGATSKVTNPGGTVTPLTNGEQKANTTAEKATLRIGEFRH